MNLKLHVNIENENDCLCVLSYMCITSWLVTIVDSKSINACFACLSPWHSNDNHSVIHNLVVKFTAVVNSNNISVLILH